MLLPKRNEICMIVQACLHGCIEVCIWATHPWHIHEAAWGFAGNNYQLFLLSPPAADICTMKRIVSRVLFSGLVQLMIAILASSWKSEVKSMYKLVFIDIFPGLVNIVLWHYVKHLVRWRRWWIWKALFQTWRKDWLGWNKSSSRGLKNCRLWKITTKPKHKATILNFQMKTTPRLKTNLHKKMTTQLLKKIQMLVSFENWLIFSIFHFTLNKLSFQINIGEVVGWKMKT